MQNDRSKEQELIELGEEALACVAGGSYRALGTKGGFDEEA